MPRRFLIFAFILAAASAVRCGPVEARLAADGRSFAVSAPGIQDFLAHWSATIRRGDGSERILSSKEGEVVPGTTIRFAEEGIDLLFQLECRADAPAVFARVGIRNTGESPVRLVSATAVAGGWKLPADLKGWFLTGFHPATPAVKSFSYLHAPEEIFEYGGCYHSNGSGFLFGPAGEPTADLNSRLVLKGGDRMAFECSADMSGARVDPGETRWGQQVVLLMAPPRDALKLWAAWVGKSHHARTGRPALSGWGSWYSFGEKVSGRDVRAIVNIVRKNPGRLHPDVILIDKGHESKERFPEGPAFYANAIASIGVRPGLKLEFDYTTDPYAAIRQAVRDGFTFIKLGDIRPRDEIKDPRLTGFELRRSQYVAAREAAGPDTYLLNSRLFPDRASVGYVDASRTGRMAWNKRVQPAINEVLRSYQLNGRWFVVDNDHFYLGTDVANVSEIAGGWPVVRTWMSMVGLSCGLAFASDPLSLAEIKPFWRNFEVMTPPAREQSEVLGLGTAWHWPHIVGHVRRGWGDATVALLWNPEDKERTIKLDFREAGMNPKQRYAVWSFWDNRYLGLTQEFWNSPSLAPSASQHLRFTPVPAASIPVLIGSNFHIYCGAVEIKRIRASRSSMEIELADAGARSGDLFIYSRFLPVLRSVTGMKFGSIDQAGENVWRVRLRDREPQAPQRLELAIQLPVTYQWWFWALIAAAAGSLLAAAWRYVEWTRLQRRHSLAEERARISRDLHDGMGADLARIGLLSEAAGRQPGLEPQVRGQLDSITASTHALAAELDSVVWATNPSNDTLEQLARYLGHYAQAFLDPTGIGLRFDIPAELPALDISSAARHNLFLSAKEALCNVVRHSGASRVFLRIRIQDGALVVEVEDDGCGLPADASAGVGADGLLNISSRMARSRGSCEYLPGANGRGTLVRLSLPLKELGA